MTEKRFKVHSMIQGMEIGETMDLELCEELIKKYGSLADIHLLIEDNGNDMTYQEVVDLLNENEQLKIFLKAVNEELDLANRDCDILEEENEQLKQRNNRQYEQLGRLYDLIEQKKWRVLTDIIDDFKKSDEQLQKEWGTYGDVE